MGKSTQDQLTALALAQYNVKQEHPIAVEEITYVNELNSVFIPAHHGPRNVPILASPLTEGAIVYTHFPIVKPGSYTVYLSAEMSEISVKTFIYKDNSGNNIPVAAEPLDPATLPSEFGAGYVTASEIPFDSDDPSPVAMEFEGPEGFSGDLEYIVVGAQ